MSVTVGGGCLCGAVRFTARVAAREVRVCACTQCLRQNGGPWFDVPSTLAVAWQGAPAVFRSSGHATRGFCAGCGSTLYWQQDDGAPALSHGAMDDRDGWRLVTREHADTLPDAFRIVAVPGGDAAEGAPAPTDKARTAREGEA